eukprot:scaffold23324_cov68-Isochrysis_galbana.AAC.1
MQATLSGVVGLRMVEAAVEDLLVEGGAVRGVTTAGGATLRSRSVVLTTGTFLRGEILVGRTRVPAGRMARPGRGDGDVAGGVGGVGRASGGGGFRGGGASGGVGSAAVGSGGGAGGWRGDGAAGCAGDDEALYQTEPSSVGVAATLARLGLPLSRLKTGTPPRLDGRTIRWGDPSLTPQPSEDPPTLLSYSNALRGRPIAPGVVTCFMAHTSDETLRVVRQHAGELPEYRGGPEWGWGG